MHYTNLGTSGLKVSRIALGMMTYGTTEWRPWVISEEAGAPVVRRAIEMGVNFFDTADMYSAGVSEEITGRLLREFTRRDETVIATKLFYPVEMGFKAGGAAGMKQKSAPNTMGLSRKRVMACVDASLKRLGVDYIDLYQIHRFDPKTPVEETMEALHDVVRAGKVRYIGASSMWAWQFAKMQSVARENGWTRFISMQCQYSLAYREEEREMLPLCRDQGVGVTPWSPLARGFLAGNRTRDDKGGGDNSRAKTDDIAHKYYYQDADYAVLEALQARAKAKGVSVASLAYGWLLSKPGVNAPIIGASKIWQVEEAVAALEVSVTDEDRAALEAPYIPHAVIDHL